MAAPLTDAPQAGRADGANAPPLAAPAADVAGHAAPHPTSCSPRSTPAAGAVPCPACDGPIVARFCPRCGEPRPDPDALSLRHVAAEVAEHVANLDGRLVRTLVLLVRRPGALLVAYRQGVRARYTRPLALFLITTAALFVAGSVFHFQLYNVEASVVNAARHRPTSALGRRVLEVQRRTGETPAQIGARAAAATDEARRLGLGLLVPGLAATLAVAYARRRVPTLEHLVLAVHLVAATLLVMLLLGSPAGVVIGWLGARDPARAGWYESTASAVVNSVALALIALHYRAALRRAHGDGPIASTVRALLLLLGAVATIALYLRAVEWLVTRAV